jgi:hypothetical protein
MNPEGGLLGKVLADPAAVNGLAIVQWRQLVALARGAQVLPRLGGLLAVHGGLAYPDDIGRLFFAAARHPLMVGCWADWEIRKVLAATGALGTEIVLLKGAAYRKLGLPVARGRALSDVDILVARDELERVERALLDAGYAHQNLDRYDQRYYRQWTHEIPPLRHPERQIEVDVHHRILPLTSRLNPDPVALWAASVPVSDRLRVLAPTDMVLHSATHLFYDGDLSGRFGELLDLHQLFAHFGAAEEFWDRLPARARELELTRPLHYALRACSQFFSTPIPARVMRDMKGTGPIAPIDGLMNVLVRRVLRPRLPGRRAPVSEWLLYVRSHWLRMPPGLLARHLGRKAFRRLRRGRESP